MNKIYRIVWNKARQCLVVCGENAQRTGKSSGSGGTGSGPATWSLATLALLCGVAPPFALAQTTIVTDGRTATTVSNAGAVYNVTTATQNGSNAFNSFRQFSVGSGNTVNLHVPSSAVNLINIVRDSRTDINGVLNAIKDGKIGGNVWFANPHGVVVGAGGVVNVGSLTVATPKQQFVDNFFSAPGVPDDARVAQLLAGTAPREDGAAITIDGRINALQGISLSAGTINVAGHLYSGARFVASVPDFTDVVNANGLNPATNVVLAEGGIRIVADSAVTISGELAAPGSTTVRGGDIVVRAGGEGQDGSIALNGATLLASAIDLKAESTYAGSLLPIAVPTVNARIDVVDSQLRALDGDVALLATTAIDLSTPTVSPIGIVTAVSTAAVDVGGNSSIGSSGATRIASSSTVEVDNKPGGPDFLKLPGDAGVAINVVVSTATTRVGGTTQLATGGALEATASNAVTATASTDAAATGATAVGGSVAVSEVTSVTRAAIEDAAQVTQSASLKVEAVSRNVVTTSAKAAAKGATKSAAGQPSKSEETLAKYKDQASTADGGVEVAAAVAVANVNSITEALVASTQQIKSSGSATVSSQAASRSTVSADGSSVSGAVGVGAAVGVNIGVLANQARIADDARLDAAGVTVSAGQPAGETNAFVTTATSGAGASNVGVAGALGVNVLIGTTSADIEGDSDSSGAGAQVNAGGGDVRVEARNESESSVTVGADVKPASAGTAAKVGVGASVGINVVVDTVDASLGGGAGLAAAHDLAIEAEGKNTASTTVTGGAAGAGVSVTPVVATTVAVNTTSARLAAGDEIVLGGAFTGSAVQDSSTSSTATGQTQGDNVAVGASLALNSATDTVSAEIARDLNAAGGASVGATSTAKSSAGATASAKGGEKAKDDGTSSSGESVDQKTTKQGNAAKAAGKKTAANAPAATQGSAAGTGGKLDGAQEAPKSEDSTEGGGVAVAAAVGVNVGVATTTAKVANGVKVTSSGGALQVKSVNETDAGAKADGSQVDAGNTSVGVGAAVALNAGISTNTATVGDDAQVTTKGLTIQAVNVAGEKSDSSAEAKSGAGAGNVGVAGALAANVVVNTTVAALEGDAASGGNGSGAIANAGTGDILIEAANETTSTVTSGAEVTGTGDAAKVGIGASIGMNVAVNTTVAEVGAKAVLAGGKDLGLKATAKHTMSTEATGGAAGAKVAVTPLVALSVAVNTTSATLGEAKAGDAGIGLSGAYQSTAEQESSTTTTASGQTQGNSVAVGASLALTTAVDTVTAEVERDISAADGVAVTATSTAKSSASATASVKGGEKAKDDGSSSSGESVDDKVAGQNDKATAAGQKTAGKAPATSPAAGSSASSKLQANKDSQTTPKSEETTQSGGVAVAAAVGVNVGVATTTAKVGKGRTITSAGGALEVKSSNQTDASAKADGSQVDSGKTGVGVGAAVALNVGISTNVAVVGENATVNTKGLTISAVNVAGEKSDYAAEATSGAGAADVGVAGSLAANVVINTTVAALEGDSADDPDAKGAVVNAGSGDILIEAANATTSAVKSGAKVEGTDAAAKVGIGASIGMNIAVNTVVAEAGDKSEISQGKDFGLNATADHTLTTEVSGGASGAKVAVTPLAAVSVAVNTTTARLGESPVEANLTGKFSSTAGHTASATTTATGQTAGSSVAVGVSLALTSAVDTVTADLERDIRATDGVELKAQSTAKSSTSATASVKGGEKAKDDGTSSSGESADDKVAGQNDKATAAGKTTAAKAPATTPAGGSSAGDKLDANKQTPPKGETSEGGVSVAAAIGVNVGVATTTAKVGKGRKVTSSAGALKVTSVNQTDTSAKADGSQVDSSKNTDVGVGAALALNVGTATTTAIVADEAVVQTQGLTISATGVTGEKSDSLADAKSGAGAGNVGVAGSLAINAAINTTTALIEGDTDNDNVVARVDAGNDAVLIEAQNATTNTVKAGADVKMSGSAAKVGVGASIGVNVAVNTTTAEAADETELIHAAGVGLNATADHAMSTEVTGGAAGAKVSITPVVAATIAVNTTTARLGASAVQLDASGAYASQATQTSVVTTKATGQAQGDVAVGASLGATIEVDNVGARVERNLDADGIALGAKSDTSLSTEVKAGAKGAKAAKKDASGNETPESGTTVDEQKKNQLDFAKGRNAKASGVNTDTPEAKTPDTTSETPSTDKPSTPPSKDQQGKKVSVAAAIGATVAYNEAKAEIAAGKTVDAGTGALKIAAESDTNYRTLATGEAVSDNVGVAAAVALTATYNKTQATLGTGATVTQAGNVDLSAISRQNRGADFQKTMSAEAVSGASGGDVAVAGSLAVVGNWNETLATVDEGVTLGSAGTPVGDVSVTADETSKISAQARAGALSKGAESKAGVGASFAVLLSYNKNIAAVGYDTGVAGVFAPTTLYADSLTVAATKNRVRFLTPTWDDAKNFVTNDIKNLNFDALDPSTYLGSNNYYTEAIAGAAAKGNAAVAGAFAIDIYGNTTSAHLGDNVAVTTSGQQAAGEHLGVDVYSRSDTQAIAFSGAVAGAKKAGVGISNTDIVNLEKTIAAIGSGSVVKSTAANAGVKVRASSRQDIANVSVSAGIGTENTGVAGVLGVIVSLNDVEASIADGATVKAKGDVAVEATNDLTTVMVSGGVGGGKEVGVGAAIAANIIANKTVAEIGDGAQVDAQKNLTLAADADETAITAVVAGSGGGKVGVAGALSVNVVVSDTTAQIGSEARINTDGAWAPIVDQNVAISARDDSVIVGIAGGGAGGGKVGVGAALDTTVLAKTVTAGIADDPDVDANVATVKAGKNVAIDATSSENVVSATLGFALGGSVGVGGAVSVGVVKNEVSAGIGQSASVDAEGNVLVNAQDDVTAVLTALAGAGGGNTGVGGSLAVATIFGHTTAFVDDNATVNARGKRDASTVYTGETVVSLQAATQGVTPDAPGDLLAKKTETAKGLSVTAYNRENLITTVIGGAGGGTAGVAGSVTANVIAGSAQAFIGNGAKVNQNNAAAGAEQQVRVKAVDETLLIESAGAGAGGGSAGVGAAANVGVVAKTTEAWIGTSTLVNAKKAVELDAASSAITFGTTAGFAGGGSAGVGGAVGAVGVANTTRAFIADASSAATAAKVNVTSGDLSLNASDLATSWLVTGAGAGGGAAGVGGSLSVGVNASTTTARIGNYAETNASGDTTVHADSVENVNNITASGAGGGSAGVAGAIGVNVVVSKTEASIGDYAQVNQVFAGQNVDVAATDRILTIAAGFAGAGGGAAGVGGTAQVTVALNTTVASIGAGAQVDAVQDISVVASAEKSINSATVAGAGGGAAGVAGAVSVIAVGSLLDGDAKNGLQTQDEDGKTVSTQSQADGQTKNGAVGDMLGDSKQSKATKKDLDDQADKLAVSGAVGRSAPVNFKNVNATVGAGADLEAGRNVTVSASDKTLAIVASGGGAGGGAAGVAGSLGVALLHESAEAYIADNAKVDAGQTIEVKAETGETVVNIGVTGCGGGAAGVCGSGSVNVVSSDTFAYIGKAEINQESTVNSGRSVKVDALSNSNLIAVAGSGGGAGAAAVGGVLNVNTLEKDTEAFIGEGAKVAADKDVIVSAASAQNIVGAGLSIQGAGAAAVGGAATVNVIANQTEARIGSARDDATKTAAVVDSDGNVVVAASDDSLVISAVGSGTGAGAAAVGGALAANVVTSQTRAYVGDKSEINARGNALGTAVDTGVTDNSVAGATPALPAGVSKDVDVDRDGANDGDISSGASFSLAGGNASGALDPASVKDSQGNSIGNAAGGLGAKGKETVKGLSVTATGNEKIISAALGVAGAGAAGVTGTATADVIASTTEASIGDGARINQSGAAGADASVRVRAADNSFVVMASGTIAGAAGAGVSGSANVAVLAKNTQATIGDADVKARNVVVNAAASEDVYVIDANVSIGAAGIGGAVGVAVVTNDTQAGIKNGATVDASGGIAVKAEQDSALDIYTLAGAGGGVALSGAFSIGVIDNTTRAWVGDGTSVATAATLDAGGLLEVSARADESITTGTVSGAVGAVGFAGSVGVKVVTSETTAEIGDYARINQTRRGGATQDVKVSASDTVSLDGGGGSGSIGFAYGAGAVAEVNVIRNTTNASIGDHALVSADHDIGVSATATKRVDAIAVALAGGASAGVAGSLAIAFVGSSLESDSDTKSGLGDGSTSSAADERMKANAVGGDLGDNEHVQGAKGELGTRSSALGVSGELGKSAADTHDRTGAYVGASTQLVAGGRIDLTATDRTLAKLDASSVAVGAAGLGASIGIGITNSTTEVKVGNSSSIEATGDVLIEASAENPAGEISSATTRAGAGGIVGLSASVAVLDDTSTTRAVLGDDVKIVKGGTVSVKARSKHETEANAYGGAIGAAAIGASVARSQFTGSSRATIGNNLDVGQTAGKAVKDLIVDASDASSASASTVAGAAGIVAGSGADAKAKIGTTVEAAIGSQADIKVTDNVTVSASAKPGASASSVGVNAGAAAIGVSLASAEVTTQSHASFGEHADVEGKLLSVTARTELPASGYSAQADSVAASGGLVGANGSYSEALFTGETTSSVGKNSSITGSVSVLATTDSRQDAKASGIAVGFVAAGAQVAEVESTSTTLASLGDDVNITTAADGSVFVDAHGTDRNVAAATGGVGGIVAGAAARAATTTTSDTQATVGQSTCGAPSATCGIVAGTFDVNAQHDSIYNAKVDTTSAAIAGASGAEIEHVVDSTVKATIGQGVKVTAGHIDIDAINASHKAWWGRNDDLNTVAAADGAAWNVNGVSGGLLTLPAAGSETTIRQETEVDIGASTLFHVILPTGGTGSFTLDALNTLVAFDKVKIDSGGAIALADAESTIAVTQNDATVTLGSGTTITSDSGDVDIGSRNDVRLDARVAANAYGLAGAPAGEAHVTYAGRSTTDVLGGVLILAQDALHGAINLAAGEDSQQQRGSIVASSTVNLWNKTAIPINTTPDAYTGVTQYADLNLAAGSNILAAGDIGLAADRGAISVSAVGIGKDLYREAAAALAGAFGIDASFEIRGGSAPTPGGRATATVNGNVLSGLLRQSATQVDVEIINPSDDPDVAPSWRLSYSTVNNLAHAGLAANPLNASAVNPYITSVSKTTNPAVVETDVAPDSQLQTRINLLLALQAQYASDPVASAAYDAEVKFLTAKLGPQGIGQNSSAVTPRASEALTAAGAAATALNQQQSLITGNVNGTTRNAQIGAVGTLVDAYTTIDANNSEIQSNLRDMKNAKLTDQDYISLNSLRSDAATAYGDLRTATTQIGNYAFSCEASAASCQSMAGPLGARSYTESDGYRFFTGSGYLGAIQTGMHNISLLALKQTGSTGTLVSNVQDLSTQMANVKTANDKIISRASTIQDKLSDAAGKQTALSTAWRDTTEGDGNVDTTRVSTVASRVTANDLLIAEFDDGTAGSAAETIKSSAANVSAAATAAASRVATVTAASDTTTPGSQKLITIPDITVKLGNVNVTAEVLAGTGKLQAPGDAKIWIINNAPASMKIGNLTVDASGGNVRLNGFLVNDEDDVRRFNPSYGGSVPTIVSRENGAAGAPEIRIVSNYNPGAYDPDATSPAQRIPAAAPDITLGYRDNPDDEGRRLSNPNGSVNVTSEAGDIYVDGTITAGSVSILAKNGDFVQQYVNGFNSVAGEPNSNIQGGPGVLAPNTNAAPGAGIVANGSIFISARYLNINGLVQSGIVNYHLDIPSDAALRFVLPENLWATYISQCGGASCTLNLSNGRSVTYDKSWVDLDGSTGRVVANKAYIDQSVGHKVDVAVTENGTRDYAAIGATYDPATQKIEMTSNVAVRGGSIELFGQIINTANGSSGGSGKLAVLDGFGQISVNNQSSLAVELKSIDTGADPDPANPGRGTVGKIKITDVQYVEYTPPPPLPEGSDPNANPGPGTSRYYATTTTLSRYQDAITVDQKGMWLANGTFCPNCTTSSYALDANSASRTQSTDARNGFYNPQAGLRYVYTTGKKTSTEYTWTFSGYSFFGTSSLSLPPDNISKTLTSGPNILSNVNLDNGIYLSYKAPAGTTAHQNNLSTDKAMVATGAASTSGYEANSTTYTNSSVYNKVREWNTCNWWTLCISSRYTSIWTQTLGQTTVTTNSVKADYPIRIEFMGSNTAGLSVTSPNAAVTLAGQSVLKNRYGDTTINAKAFAAGASSLIDTRDLAIFASNGSIGSIGAPVNTLLSGELSAAATGGNVVINQIAGALQVDQVSATGTPTPGNDKGKVILSAQDDIYGAAGNLVSGARVELYSATGEIGGIAGHVDAHAPLNVAPGFTADRADQPYYGLKAAAAGDIGIDVKASAGRNDAGHLLADTIVSAGGDVRITAPGQIIDNNPVQSIDSRAWNDLLGFWNSLGLVAGDPTNSAKVGQAIVSYENSRTQDYAQYWQIRDSQNPPAAYDATWRYTASAAERDALTARGQSIADFEKNRTDRYWALHTEVSAFDAQVYARSAAAATIRQANPLWTQAQVDAQVLADERNGLLPTVGVPTARVTGFTYVAAQSERDPYESTGSWTTPQLALSVNPGLLKDITDTNPVIKAPNVSGRNVTLIAGQSIGSTLPSTDPNAVFIPYDTDGNISDAAKIALATAEYSDFKFDVVKNGKTGLQVEQRLPLNFSATTGIEASVRSGGVAGNPLTAHTFGTDLGNAYLASLGSGIIRDLSVDGELRFKVKGAISAVDPTQVVIHAGDLVLEAANASIAGNLSGTLPLRVDVAQDSGATADSYGSVTARAIGIVNIASTDDLKVGGVFSRDAITLASEGGSILDAHPATGLDVLGGTVRLMADGSIGDLNGGLPLSVGTNVGTPLSGLIEAAAGDSVFLYGTGVGAVNSNFNFGPVIAGHNAITAGDSIRINAAGDALINGDVVGVGPIEFSIGGKLTLAATRPIEVDDAGAPGGRSTIVVPPAFVHATGVGVTVDANELVMGDGARILADTGTISIQTTGDAIVTGIESGNPTGGAISIVSSAGRILDGGDTRPDIVAKNGPDATLNLDGALGIGDDPIEVDASRILARSGGVIDLSAAGDVEILGLTAADRVWLTAQGDISGGPVTGSSVIIGTPGAITLDTINVGSNLQLAGNTIDANVFGSGGPVGGSIGGFGGAPASSVTMSFSNPGGFALGSFSAVNADVVIPLGAFSVGSLTIVQRGTFSNPQTDLLVDQVNKGIQPADVQLYSGGSPFSLSLTGNTVGTSSFVIHSDPQHEVVTPSGEPNVSADQQGDESMARLRTFVPSPTANGDDPQPGMLVSFSGTPVAVDCEPGGECEE